MGRRKARPSPYTPPVVKEEDVLLYKDAKAAEALKKEMNFTPEQEKRLKKMEEAEADKQRKYAMKLTNRADVIAILGMYVEQNILPFGARLDTVEMYIRFLELPFYRRWWVKTVRLWKRITGFVMKNALRDFVSRIKFVKTKGGDGGGPEGREQEGAREPGAESGGGEGAAPEVRYPDSGLGHEDG